VSAGTSVFAMIVMQKPLSKVYPEIDIVTTPAGRPVAMVHSNNCTSDLNEWVGLFGEFADALGVQVDQTQLFGALYRKALSADPDGGGLLAYNPVSGEHITRLETGCPLFVRPPESTFTLANFMRTHLYAALAALRIGLDILFEQENVEVDTILGHGGFFKTAEVGQKMMAAAMGTPVAVMETAGEGGPWGMAILAAYLARKDDDQSLEEYLADRVFADQKETVVSPDPADVTGFKAFMTRYKKGLVIERTAGEVLG
jgi:sugar (pentulose or hexulose) kinase